MRSVIISSVILGLILTLTVINTVLLDNFCEELITKIEHYDVKSKNLTELEDMYDDFDAKSVFINLTVNHTITGGVREAFYELIATAEGGDEEGAHIAKSRLTYEVKRLWEMEKFSVTSIV